MISGMPAFIRWSWGRNPDTTAGGPKMPFCAEAWDAISRYIYTALQGAHHARLDE